MRTRIFKITVIALVIGAFVILYQHTLVGQWLNPRLLASKIDQLRQWEHQLGMLGPLVFYLLASIIIVLNVPTALVIAIAAVLYGPVGAIVLGTLSFSTAIILMYFIAKQLNQGLTQKLVQKYLPRTHQYIQSTGLRTIIYLRLIFFALPPVNWMLAIMCTQLQNYFWGSLIGAFPNIIVFSWLGGALIETIRLNRSLLFWNNPDLTAPTLLGLFLVLSSLLLRKKNTTSS